MAPATVKLASGHEMPLVGFGLWKVPADKTSDVVYNAIKTGYRLFDGAYDYANSKELGEGVRRAIDEGLIKREEVFITTKLWNNYHAKEHALEMARKQNEELGLGYIDLFLIHFPVSLEYISPEKRRFPGWWLDDEGTIRLAKVPISETWGALEQLVDEGVTRSIGVSNFSAQLVYDVLNYARHPLSALQIEHHPYLVQPDLIELAQESNIAVTAYSTFGPQSFLELPPQFKERPSACPSLLEHELITSIAKKHNVQPSQVLLRWCTQRNIAVIPKSNNQNRLAQNLDVVGFDLEFDELKAIAGLDLGLRFNDPGFYLKNKPIRIFA